MTIDSIYDVNVTCPQTLPVPGRTLITPGGIPAYNIQGITILRKP